MIEKGKEVVKINKPKFLLVEEYYDPYFCVAVDWSDLREEVFNEVPSDLLYNISAVEEESGKLIERTIVYLYPVEKFDKKDKVLDNGDIEIVIDKEN